ncbi:MAG TPA: ATP-binding protein [Mucilaginibacter sp.]|nr:ATP-binding protein [Mucilaginibacter sp.]
MKKIGLMLCVLTLLTSFAKAQRKQIDSLNRFISRAPDDSTKVKAYFQLGDFYTFYKPDSGIIAAQRGYDLAVRTKNQSYQRRCIILMANLYVGLGNYTKAMQLYFGAIRLAEKENNKYALIQTHNNIGSTYIQMGDYAKALLYLRLGLNELHSYIKHNNIIGENFRVINVYLLENCAEAFLFTKKLDSAAYYIDAGTKAQEQSHFYDLKSVLLSDRGQLEAEKRNREAALKYYHEAEALQLSGRDLTNLDLSYLGIADLYEKVNMPDSAIFYAEKALSSARQGNFLQDASNASKMLYRLYDKQHNIPQAYKYYKIATITNDSLFNQEKVRQLVALDFEEKQRQQEIAASRLEYENQVRTYIFSGGLGVLLLLAYIFWRNSRQRKKANNLLREQKEEIETTLEQLKATQAQLIQSEKMASLGELTAGIAHEIQNPLNFINNFSDVNRELADELREELKNGNVDEAIAIANDIQQNEEKINHHGKRADSIVKGMLQHSRANTGERQLTDINALAAEFFKLSYHGLRAKDKSFNAEMITNFADGLPLISVVQQDVSRLFINLFNNAFYAVNKKQKTAGAAYHPEVSVSTVLRDNNIVITVRDNGTGMPDAIKDKIMQPFFTSKPAGEGTGLGLSLSYDIVVKGHSGTIDFTTEENEFTEFVISFPVS